MTDNSNSPEDIREKLRQEELKNPASSIKGSNLADLVGGASWKVSGMIIILLVAVLGFVMLFAN